MKLRNLLVIVVLAAVGLLGSSNIYAQAFQTGDIIIDDYGWYHSDGTFVGYLPYGACGPCTFIGPGPFDLLGNHYEDYFTSGNPNDSNNIDKFDPSGNFVNTIVNISGAGLGATQLVLDAKDDVYVMFTYYNGSGYSQQMNKYDRSGNLITGWAYSGLGYGVTGDLSRDQKTMYLSSQNGLGVASLNLKTRVLKGLACGNRALRVLGDGSYLATDGFSNVQHCSAAGKLIHTYPIPPAVGDNLVGIGLDPDGQTFLVGGYLTPNVYRVDFNTGRVTTAIPYTNVVASPFNIEVYGMAEVGQCPLLQSATVVKFPLQTVGTSSLAKTVKLTDGGVSPVPVGSLALSGANAKDFAETDTCSGTNLGVGKKCSASLTFTPSAAGKRSATLAVPHSVASAACSPLTISLTGTGTP